MGSRDSIVSPALAHRVRELCRDAHETLGADIAAPHAGELSVDIAASTTGRIWQIALGETLRSADDPGGPAEGRRHLAELLDRIRTLEFELAEARIAGTNATFARVAEALHSMRDIRSVDELLARAPEASRRLGFDRVLVSRVENSLWKLHTMSVVRDPRWAEEILEVGRSAPPSLDGPIIEADVVRLGEARLIFDAGTSDRVDRRIIQVARPSSYGVAPLTVHGEVIGLLHGDCYHQGRTVDATDRILLSVMAEGLSQALGRLLMLDGLSAIRGTVERLTARPSAAPPPAHRTHETGLTTREVEIIELLAAGWANRTIARRLSISESTVKAHVTHILRKLNVTSRTEAVAYWLRHRTTDD